MARNNIPAFWQDQNWRYIWVNFGLDRLVQATVLRYPRTLLKEREVLRHFKAVDAETGKLMGYIRWQLPYSRYKNQDGSAIWPEGLVPDVTPEAKQAFIKQAEEADWEPLDFGADDPFDSNITRRKNELLGTKDYLVLDYVAVHPDHQGNGIASALVQHGIKKAKELGLPVFVLAFEAGFRLYEKAGFKVLDTLDQDASKIGGTEHYIARLMELSIGE
ncbi:acyl-CoA N-acyltransferase [Coniella lustricola]|uniref:Acyl-CoA N-acyltransferase n=1 Tax=Coniella lustricola TaxID=2025994 RepID=A0A2T3A8A8_9PEZI|nr:acyl-CoA N-acyltransferase [Coniella lustricola]